MPFQFEHLRTLTALVDEGTFEAAARALHVTPSAVSQRVRAMEQAVGKVLVRRTTPVATTPAGDVVLRHARQVLALDEDALGELGADEGDRLLPVAVNADSLSTWFLEALAVVTEELGVAFEVHREDEEHTTSLLRSGTVMAAVTSTPEAVQGCTVEGLGTLRYLVVCTPEFHDRHLGGRRDPGLLANSPMVTFDRRDDLQDRFLREALGLAPSGPRHYIPASQDFARAVHLGMGWGAVPEGQCRDALAAGELVHLAPDHPVEVRLYWQRWNLRSPALDRLTEVVRRHAAAGLHPL
ncbi:LysR family transcriptional regulator ArgP [Nocardiopsis changdeensis]|uniref:LysR family transcriptional regulator ArgP n=1 Tax=Nocardiopsis changdeensis TaxID=2831969 RepID=A0ABX8BD93_9ACTN|nr:MULTISPECIES: LysR family transcriptional regulator ArgP [Nocardiopsis]QUX20221.1 LysR family transcriptional regulator ArgP [Nocardiopsis changdeensis]QYX36149.1 LysR family transcriptional regulator ArgP [Nocardiopsis sp. MT53]